MIFTLDKPLPKIEQFLSLKDIGFLVKLSGPFTHEDSPEYYLLTASFDKKEIYSAILTPHNLPSAPPQIQKKIIMDLAKLKLEELLDKTFTHAERAENDD